MISVGAADIDDVAALITSEVPAAAAGTEQRGDEVVFWVATAEAPAALAEVRDAVVRWRAGGLAVDPARVRIAAAMPEAEWRDAWKKYFRVSRLTRQFVVVPSWESFAAGPDDVVIDLDPGMAFGTGTHASTQLVLEEIQALADRPPTLATAPTRILDVGCGSGILAIAAVKRWPGATCVAIDNDPLAVAATRDNAAQNGVADRIAASTRALDPDPSRTDRGEDGPGGVPDRPGDEGPRGRSDLAGDDGSAGDPEHADHGDRSEPFALVLANIQAHVLRALRGALVGSLAPGGTLVLSGLLTPQAQPLADEFVAEGLHLVHVRASAADPQWSCAVLMR